MVSLAYEHLARLSIFVDAARKEEMTARHELNHTHFEQLFHGLEANASGGLYAVMCALQTVFRPLVCYRSNVPILGMYRVQDIRRICVPTPSSSAERHYRDFCVVRRLKDVASKLVDDVRRM